MSDPAIDHSDISAPLLRYHSSKFRLAPWITMNRKVVPLGANDSIRHASRWRTRRAICQGQYPTAVIREMVSGAADTANTMATGLLEGPR